LLFVGWDGSLGKAGGRLNTTPAPGLPISANAGLVVVTVAPAPHAPAWNASALSLPDIQFGGANPGETVEQAFSGAFMDPTTGQPTGIAVTGLTGTAKQGVWQYQLASGNGTWTSFPKVSAGTALLLGPNDMIRFDPLSPTFTGLVTLQVHAWDGTPVVIKTGTAGDGATVSLSKKGTTGGTTPLSTTILTGKLYVNDVPTQNAALVTLAAVAENATSKTVSVAVLLKDVKAFDADKRTLGMAVTNAAGPGNWQYELPGGTWQNVPATVGAAAALLLPSNALLHFVPAPGESGSATLSWEDWDQTQGAAGLQSFNTTSASNIAAFSSQSASATLTINPSATPLAPAWIGNSALLTPVVPGTPTPTNQVSAVFGSYFADPSAVQMGIAISGATGTTGKTPSGTWKYSTNGGTSWQTLPAVSAKKALLLTGSDLIEFVPNAGFLGTATLTVHAWDGTAIVSKTGTAGEGGTVNLTLKGMTGGTSHISATTLTATVLVNTSPTVHA
jgi:hypothetical protein